MSVLNKQVSFYPGILDTKKGVELNLLDILRSDTHKDKILEIRQCVDIVKQKELKNALPCFTVAGTFNPRSEKGLIQISGLGCVDLDSAEDYDAIELLKELKKIDSIAYAGLSCRGNRIYCIVPFLYPDKYLKHYQRLIQSFTDMGLPMGDDCHKTLSQPRYVSFNDDSTHFFNHIAKPYHLLPAEKSYHIIKKQKNLISNATASANAFDWCKEQINKNNSFSENGRHAYLVKLARYCNLKGVPESETLTGCLSYIQEDFLEKEIKDIVAHVYTNHADSHNRLPYLSKIQTANNV